MLRQFPEKEPYIQNELDYQLHYMRRMLNSCMDLLTEHCDFYQVFTHPDVYGYNISQEVVLICRKGIEDSLPHLYYRYPFL